jgi:Zn-finger nucleic acid-binding protein
MQALEGLIDQLREEHGTSATPAAPDKEDLRQKLNCPQCHHPMDAHFYAGPGNAVINSCEQCCLIWMDRGVVMRIARAPDAPAQSSAPLPVELAPEEASVWSSPENLAVESTIAGLFLR